jgi:hypothetical protein
MTAYELFFWAPFGILGAALVIYVLVSWRYWFVDDGYRHPAE